MSDHAAQAKLSVVIVAYQNRGDLEACLNSLQRFNDIGPGLEVIVVDNSPSLELFEWLCSSQPWVIAIKNVNRGFGEGNNVGSERASAPYLAFLNPDTELVEPIFDQVVRSFERIPGRGAVGVRVLAGNGKRGISYFWVDGGGIVKGFLQHCFQAAGIYIPARMCTSGADLFVRRSAFERSGRFDERFFLYNEEADLWRRMTSLGYRWDYDRTVRLVHKEGGSMDGQSHSLRCRLESLRLYCEKYSISYRKRLSQESRYLSLKILVLRACRSRFAQAARSSRSTVMEYLVQEELTSRSADIADEDQVEQR